MTEEELDKEVEKYRYLRDGAERSKEEMKAIRNFQRRRFTQLKEFEKSKKEDERIKEVAGRDFEEYYQNNIKGAVEVYGNNTVYHKDSVNKDAAWKIWKEAWKVFERKKCVVREI